MPYRVLKIAIDPPLERECPECRARVMMKSTGDLFHERTGWFVAFYCPEHCEYFPVWAPEYRELIETHTRSVDPESLPFFGKPT
jgi:hypothetical protein